MKTQLYDYRSGIVHEVNKLVGCTTMIYYKSVRLINRKPRRVISDENYNIIKNPTKEQIKIAIDEQYRPKMCCICDKKESFPNWYNHRCDKYNCTGHICTICYQKYDPKSSTNLRKRILQERHGMRIMRLTQNLLMILIIRWN